MTVNILFYSLAIVANISTVMSIVCYKRHPTSRKKPTMSLVAWGVACCSVLLTGHAVVGLFEGGQCSICAAIGSLIVACLVVASGGNVAKALRLLFIPGVDDPSEMGDYK